MYIHFAIISHRSYLAGGKTQAYFELAKKVPNITVFHELTDILESLDDHLAFRAFLVGYDVTAADIIVWGALKGRCTSSIRSEAY